MIPCQGYLQPSGFGIRRAVAFMLPKHKARNRRFRFRRSGTEAELHACVSKRPFVMPPVRLAMLPQMFRMLREQAASCLRDGDRTEPKHLTARKAVLTTLEKPPTAY